MKRKSYGDAAEAQQQLNQLEVIGNTFVNTLPDAANDEEGGEAEAVNWQRFDQTFPTKQPLLLNVKGVANRNDLQQVTNHW